VPRVFLDTNVLAYDLDAGSPDKQAKVRKALASPDHDFVISTQVLLELYVVLTRKLRPALPESAAAEVIASLCRLPVVGTDAELVQRAIALSVRHQLSVWDALIVTAAREAGCEELWTEDLATGSELRGVKIVNPMHDGA
jgi:predicted nucleic acid-binding protein